MGWLALFLKKNQNTLYAQGSLTSQWSEPSLLSPCLSSDLQRRVYMHMPLNFLGAA